MYPCLGQMENVGVTVMYGSRKPDSARRTSVLQACDDEIASFI